MSQNKDKLSKAKMGKVIPLFKTENPLEIPMATKEELDTFAHTLISQLENSSKENMSLYELTEEHMRNAESYMTENGQIVAVPIEDMDDLVGEIMDASERMLDYERTLQQIANRPNELGAKIARNILLKHKGTPD